MIKVVIHRRGGYERLELEEHPTPVLHREHVLIDVEGIGVNYADCIVRMGLYRSAREFVGWPITPGFEVAGTVARVGPGVDEALLGTKVMAVTRFGGYATQVVVPVRQVFDVPAGWSPVQAAGMPAVSLTAEYALSELARPREGAWVLVHSAAGGVGGTLVQLARARGCNVVGVVGAPHKVEIAREHGAVAVIDKSSEDLWAAAQRHAPPGYAAIFDANGVETLRASYRHLAPTGRLVVYGFHTMLPRAGARISWLRLAWAWLRTPRFDPLDLTDKNRSVMGFNLSYLFDRSDLLAESMERLGAWIEAGHLMPPPVTLLPLEQVADAHRALESGSTVGKLVLTP